jgi:tetratricopeptide (TPR) repeat protein
MHNLIIEVNNYKQLLRVKPSFWEEVEGAISGIAESRGGKKIREENGLLFFQFRVAGTAESLRVLDAVFALWEALKKISDELAGFLLFLEFFGDSVSDESAFRDMKESLRHIEIGESLVAGSSAADFLKNYCELEKEGTNFRVLRRKSAEKTDAGRAEDFCIREPVVAELEKELALYLDCRKPAQPFLVYGPIFSGAVYQVRGALRKLLGTAPVMTLYPNNGETLYPSELVSNLDDPIIDEIPEFLTLTERNVWEEKKNVLSFFREVPKSRGRRFPEFLSAELVSAYLLVLTSFKRRCEAELAPAVMVCEDIHSFSPGAKELLSRFFIEMIPKWSLFPICTSRKGQLGHEFRDLAFEKFRIPPLGTEEFKNRLTSDSAARIRRRINGKIELLYHEILAGTETEAEEAGNGIFGEDEDLKEELGLPLRFLFKQEAALREILYVSYRAGDLVSLKFLENFFESIDITRVQGQILLNRLKDYGFVRDGYGIRPVLPELFPGLSRDPSIRVSLVEEKLCDFLYRHWKLGDLPRQDLFLRYVQTTSRHDRTLEVYRSTVSDLLDAGDWEEARALLYGGELALEQAAPEIAEAAEAVVLSGRLRLAMGTEDPAGTEELFSRLDSLPVKGNTNPYCGDSLLQKALYHVKHRDLRGALALSKNAVLLYQERNDVRGLIRANTALGIILMSHENITEGIDYFHIARAAADEEGNRSERIRCDFFAAAAYFIRGNFSRVIEICNKISEEADSFLMRRWAVLSRFLIGRSLFELGEYEKAREVFERLLAACGSLEYQNPIPVIFGWLGRCLIYQGKPEEGLDVLRPLPAGGETLFFRAEAEYFLGDGEKARESIDQALRRPSESDCFWGDGFFWTDGFYFIENIALGRTKGVQVLRQLSRAFRAFLLALSGESISGIEEMASLTREEKNSENDPYNRLYYYWYSRILPENRDRIFEDRLTILGKAVNQLQSRISRIDDPRHKTMYAGKNLWNRMLLEEARSHNLV